MEYREQVDRLVRLHREEVELCNKINADRSRLGVVREEIRETANEMISFAARTPTQESETDAT